jgi:hypothetical protein
MNRLSNACRASAFAHTMGGNEDAARQPHRLGRRLSNGDPTAVAEARTALRLDDHQGAA